jgi:hypothetical protein
MPVGMLRRATAAAALGLSAALMSACAGAKAAPAMPAATPLSIPAPPARVVVPPAPEPPPPPPEPAAPATPPATTPTRPARDPKPTPPPAPPATPPAQPPAPATPPTPLQSTTKQGELEEKAVMLYDTAKAMLDKIDRRTLSSDGRAQYDTAVRFLAQSKSAREAKNIVFAWQLAEKAHTIATLLQR